MINEHFHREELIASRILFECLFLTQKALVSRDRVPAQRRHDVSLQAQSRTRATAAGSGETETRGAAPGKEQLLYGKKGEGVRRVPSIGRDLVSLRASDFEVALGAIHRRFAVPLRACCEVRNKPST